MSRLHQPTGHWKIGFALAVFTSLCWGGLPVALKVLLRHVDPITLSWFRFAFAGVVMISWLTARRQLPSFARSNRKLWSLLAVVSLGLTANYIFFQRGIPLTGAGAAQVVIQLSPVMLLVGSVFVFKEQMSRLQWLGLVVTLIGFGVFFVSGQHDNPAGDDAAFVTGLGYILISGLAWVAYALAQKQLLVRYSSAQIMTVVYCVAALLMTPFAQISVIWSLSPLILAILIGAGANTVLAYGAFAESLAHWEGSRVSAVLSLTPVLTLSIAAVGGSLWPEFVGVEHLSLASYGAAGLVISGSLVTSLAKRRPSEGR